MIRFSSVERRQGVPFWLRVPRQELSEVMQEYLQGGGGVRGVFAEVTDRISTDYYQLETTAHAVLAGNDNATPTMLQNAGLRKLTYDALVDEFFPPVLPEEPEKAAPEEEVEDEIMDTESAVDSIFDALESDATISLFDDDEDEEAEPLEEEYCPYVCVQCGRHFSEEFMNAPRSTAFESEGVAFCCAECYGVWSRP